MSTLQDAVVVVTGAAAGIGLATSTALRSAGAQVVPVDVDPAVLVQPDAVVANLAHEREVLSVADRVLHRFGRWDALVNNAGLGRHNPISEISTDALDLMWAVNVRATILLTREAFRAMRPAGGGQVVNVVSTAGLRGEPGESAYCATKAAVRAFTEASVDEGRLHGIRVHGIYPAGVDTSFWREATADGPGVDPATAFLTPQDVAAAIVAMLSLPRHVHQPQLVLRALADGPAAATAAKLSFFHAPRRV